MYFLTCSLLDEDCDVFTKFYTYSSYEVMGVSKSAVRIFKSDMCNHILWPHSYKVYKKAVISPRATLRCWAFAEASIGMFGRRYDELSDAFHKSANKYHLPEIFAVKLGVFRTH